MCGGGSVVIRPDTGPASVGGPSVGVEADQAEATRTTFLDWPSCVQTGH